MSSNLENSCVQQEENPIIIPDSNLYLNDDTEHIVKSDLEVGDIQMDNIEDLEEVENEENDLNSDLGELNEESELTVEDLKSMEMIKCFMSIIASVSFILIYKYLED